ncbi:MAG: hypothetical protein OJF55_001912 [Rhodanobacteraceae bacterium]|nr:MAG: hypothetical protein OJF55_001912 [Rhodanobacteraceae bacterium]
MTGRAFQSSCDDVWSGLPALLQTNVGPAGPPTRLCVGAAAAATARDMRVVQERRQPRQHASCMLCVVQERRQPRQHASCMLCVV